MRRVVMTVACDAPAFVVATVVGASLIGQLSANTHDRPTEAATTGAFVFGPIGELVGCVAGFAWAGRRLPGRHGNGH